MNPFLKDPVAQPLDVQSSGSWRAPFKRHRTPRRRPPSLSRRAGAAMMVAGLAVAMPTQALDVNTASIAQLESLRGIGPRTAKMIVSERSRAGAFASLEDLSDRVRGLGERRVRALSQAGLEVRSAQEKGELETGIQHTVAKVLERRSKPLEAKPEIISPQSF